MIVSIDKNNFTEEIINYKKYILIYFWAESCQPCKILSPIINTIADTMQYQIKVVKISLNNHAKIFLSFGVRSVPTLILFKEKRQLSLKTGVYSKKNIQEWINSLIL